MCCCAFLTSHPDQGMTPKLSKFWMPLDAFTKETMEGLCRGNVQVPAGDSKEKWEQYEKGKLEQMNSARKN